MPGRDPGGIIVTILIGIAGSFVGTMIGRALGLYRQGQGCGIHHVAAGLELKFRQLSALVSEDSAFMASVGARSGMRLTDVLERQLHLVERSPRIVTMREPNGSQLVLRVGGEALQVVVGLRVDDPRAINCAADCRPARRARVHEEATQALLGEPSRISFWPMPIVQLWDSRTRGRSSSVPSGAVFRRCSSPDLWTATRRR